MAVGTVRVCLIQGRSSNPYPFMVDSILIAILTAYGLKRATAALGQNSGISC